ncbi:MAG TPA: tetratricopeptide repeat protein, partial [Polyangiaceae bacterium]|nr:tetratricopeptide repeat protein [Polyangiaceae bacterium]
TLGSASLHGLRVGLCDPGEGFLLLLLGPGFGALLGGATGAYIGLFARRISVARRRALVAVGLALLAPISGIVVSLVRFYTSPMVFAYDPYFGYFSGPLYDTVIGSLWPLVSYRVGTLGSLGVLGALSLLLGQGSLWRALRGRPNVGLLAAFSGGLSLLVSWYGTELGHFSTPASIARTLARSAAVGRCDLVYSSSILESDARRLGRECHAHLEQVERFFGVKGPERVRVYLFANEGEKARLMGAARTYIAKPWRGEVYVQAAGFPHPVLGHELAHVVSRSFGSGPFRVAGLLGGWLPDPGRIEGIATAAAPDENDALTLEEWAAAMLRLRLLPELSSLFRLSFFGHNAAQAYTAAGAFVRFLHAELGAEAVRRWYAGESLAQVSRSDLKSLESRWHRSLSAVPLSEAVLANARARFERPAFFQRRCPRIIDRHAGEAQARLGVGDFEGARQGFRQVLALDPRDSGARLGLAACEARSGKLAAASARYEALAAAADAAPWAKLAALEARADVLLREGQLEGARARYAELAQRLVDEDRLRTLDVKRLADSGVAREALVTLLIGEELGPSWDVAAAKLGKWSALDSSSGLADYLLAKNLYNRGRFKDAGLYLDRALGRKLPEPRVLDEALRLRAVVGCAVLDRDAARWALERLRLRPLSASRREGIERLAERCAI